MLKISLLGAFQVIGDGIGTVPAQKSARLLLAYLALNRGIRLPRRTVADDLFSDLSDSLGTLRTALKLLRRSLGSAESILYADDSSIAMKRTMHAGTGSAVWIDCDVITEACREGASLEVLEQALALTQGIFLAGIEDHAWVTARRAYFELVSEDLMQRALERFAQSGRWDALTTLAERCIANDVLAVLAFGHLMRAAHTRHGQAAMEHVYERFSRWAEARDLIMPKEIAVLHNQLRASEAPKPTLPVNTLPEPVTRTVISTPPTAFVGRHQDLADLLALLDDPACQLITVLGMGGIGKSRLSLEAARTLDAQRRFQDGIVVVRLEQVADGASALAAIGTALGLKPRPQAPLQEQLSDMLHERNALLLLDACETVLTADAAFAPAVDALLSTAPGIKALATSRERFHLSREFLFELDGLSFGHDASDPTTLSSDAIQLFALRARQVDVRFRAQSALPDIVRICRLTGGAPLALELAAAWTRTLPCAAIADQLEAGIDLLTTELRDVPHRHRSMRAAISYSWSQLSPAAQTAFARLATCIGSLALPAAMRLGVTSMALLDQLVDKSMLRRDALGRYSMHDLLRQFGQEQASALGIAEDATRQLTGIAFEMATTAWPQDPAHEWQLLASAMRAAEQLPDAGLHVALALALAPRWFDHGRIAEMRALLPAVSNRCSSSATGAHAAEVLVWRARAEIELGEFDSAAALLTRAEAHSATSDPVFGQIRCAHARLAVERYDFSAARTLVSEILAERTRYATVDVADALALSAHIHYQMSEDDAVIRLASEAITLEEIHRPQGPKIETLSLLATTLAYNGRIAEARELTARAVKLARRYGSDFDLAEALFAQAHAEEHAQQLSMARATTDLAIQHYARAGDRKDTAHAWFHRAIICFRMGHADDALSAATQAQTLYQAVKNSWHMPPLQLLIGDIHASVNHADEAARTWRAGLASAEQQNHPVRSDLSQRLGGTATAQ